jgi:hypothetical protein
MTRMLNRAVKEAEDIGISSSDELARIGQNSAEAAKNGRKFTEPTLPTGGKPKGSYEVPTGDPETIRSITRQNEAADLLATNGYDVTVQKAMGDVTTPDYIIDGVAFDCYSPTTTRVRNIYDTIKGKIGKQQANSFVLNLDDFPGSMDELVKQFYDWNFDIPGLEEILMVKNGKIARLIIN